MFLSNEVVFKEKVSFVKFFCLVVTFCYGFSAEVWAQKIRVDAYRYLKIVPGIKPSGEDAIITLGEKGEATDFTVRNVWALRSFSEWVKQIVFVPATVLSKYNSQGEFVCLGCDHAGALKLFPDALLADFTVKKGMENNVIWRLVTYSLKGSVLVETVLEFGRWHLMVEHPVLNVKQ